MRCDSLKLAHLVCGLIFCQAVGACGGDGATNGKCHFCPHFVAKMVGGWKAGQSGRACEKDKQNPAPARAAPPVPCCMSASIGQSSSPGPHARFGVRANVKSKRPSILQGTPVSSQRDFNRLAYGSSRHALGFLNHIVSTQSVRSEPAREMSTTCVPVRPISEPCCRPPPPLTRGTPSAQSRLPPAHTFPSLAKVLLVKTLSRGRPT